jgi:hypothetical protein
MNDTVATLLPANFTFSQSSLQAYVDCARRFWLAYVEQLPWPAVEASPVQQHEELMRLGDRFHRLVQRSEEGIDSTQVATGLTPPLADWFAAYQQHRLADLPGDFTAVERILTIPLILSPAHALTPAPAFRLAAKYDLLAGTTDGRTVIVDWKTAKRRADPATLRQRLQTIVYPYVLVEASAGLPWGPVQPEQVTMVYWFTAAPGQPVSFRYDTAQHEANGRRLHQLLAAVLAARGEVDFPKVTDTEANRRHLCAYCVYRSRCNRGVAAGELEALDDPETFFAVDVEKALEFSLDDVEELAF